MTDMFAPADPKQSSIAAAWHREQFRKSNDTIRISNPTDFIVRGKPFKMDRQPPAFNQAGDYLVEWDHYYHRVPFGQSLDTTRYIAIKYCREMNIVVIGAYVQMLGDEMKKKAKAEVLLDKYLESNEIWMKLPKTDDPDLAKEIYPQLWVGVVKRFGLDNQVNANDSQYENDLRPTEEKVLETLNEQLIIDVQPDKAALVEELTNVDQG